MFNAGRHTIAVADTVLAMRTGQLVLVDEDALQAAVLAGAVGLRTIAGYLAGG